MSAIRRRRHPSPRISLPRVAGCAVLISLLIAGCGDDSDDEPGAAGDSPAATSDDDPTVVATNFSAEADDGPAVTYDDDALPIGQHVEVTVEPADDGTGFALQLTGVEAERDFGAHLHTKKCAANPDDAGPHYQDELDPEQPSTDPAYANPENEVWLDLTTDGSGNGSSDTSVAWTPRAGEANSVVIHEMHTMTGHGEAGAAGDRLARIDIPL